MLYAHTHNNGADHSALYSLIILSMWHRSETEHAGVRSKTEERFSLDEARVRNYITQHQHSDIHSHWYSMCISRTIKVFLHFQTASANPDQTDLCLFFSYMQFAGIFITWLICQ